MRRIIHFFPYRNKKSYFFKKLKQKIKQYPSHILIEFDIIISKQTFLYKGETAVSGYEK